MNRHPASRDGEGRVRYRAFGFEIASEIEFSQLVPAVDPRNAPPADVVFRFERRDEPATGGPGVLHLATPALEFAAREGREVVVAVREAGAGPQYLERLVLANGLNAIAFQRGLVPLHANACRIGDTGLLLCGGKGAGKSTLAAALAQAGHALLSDDLAILHPGPGGWPVVWPGGFAVKLEEPALTRFPGASCLASPVDWDPKALVRVGATPDGVPVPVPVRAICLLERGDFVLRRLDRLEAAAVLPSILRRPHWQAKSEKSSAIYQAWLETASKAPVFLVKIPHGLDAVPATIDKMMRMF